ncbi:hypothetical protein MMC22_002672 [Lobaria immixta]|nr:hypothetical protein [Lobaria immixta]
MSKALTNFGNKVTGNTKQLAKLFKDTSPGRRILPSQTSKNDEEYECRIDMGEEVRDKPGVRVVYLQVNSQAQSQKLREWLAKNPHGNLATGQIDTNVPEKDQGEEGKRLMNGLVKDGKENL